MPQSVEQRFYAGEAGRGWPSFRREKSEQSAGYSGDENGKLISQNEMGSAPIKVELGQHGIVKAKPPKITLKGNH
jgi:hypothetical protein